MSSIQTSLTTPFITSSTVSRSTQAFDDIKDDSLDYNYTNDQYSIYDNQLNQSYGFLNLTSSKDNQEIICATTSEFDIDKDSPTDDHEMPKMVCYPINKAIKIVYTNL